MKKKVADMWVKALRSGKYKQGKNRLHKKCGDGNESFCCLGVLCNIAKNHIKLDIEEYTDFILYDNSISTLPLSVRNWSGIKNRFGDCIGSNTCLVYMNDTLDKSFSEIADFIENNYENL